MTKKEMKGITLVALVITIILLLILAGISIASLTENGLFEKAKLAKEKQENAQIEEDEKLGDYENEIGKYVDGNRDDIVGTYDTIFSGNAKEAGKKYNLLKSINDYKYIIVYARGIDDMHYISMCIDKEAYNIGKKGEIHCLFAHAYDSHFYFIFFNFNNDKELEIYNKDNNGWHEGEIYLIKGIK